MTSFGPLTAHMTVHVLLMNVLAPIAAMVIVRRTPPALEIRFPITPPMVGQLALLWAWHAPPVLTATMTSMTLHTLMQISLLTAALIYWMAVMQTRDHHRWRAIASLLFTSKLFCLLAVLYVFAPRILYPDLLLHHAKAHGSSISTLADQQLSGLLMLAACPITYLAAGVWMTARWLAKLSVDQGGPPRSRAMRPASHNHPNRMCMPGKCAGGQVGWRILAWPNRLWSENRGRSYDAAFLSL